MQFAVMLTVLSNLIQYFIYVRITRKSASTMGRIGPVLCITMAALLLMVHPTVFLLKDLKIMPPICSYGRLLIAATHCGFVLLACGAAWAVGVLRTPPSVALKGLLQRR